MSLSLADFDYIRRMVRDLAAISLRVDQSYLAEARLGVLARREGFGSLQALVAEVRAARDAGDGLRRRVAEAMTTNESSFFRDFHPFEALRASILPGLIARRAADRTLRIWCAACSGGQEPYSIAMILREHFAAQLDGWDISILATDLSAEMLAKARAGRYSPMEVGRGVPGPLLAGSFIRAGADWQIRDEIRRMVTFRHLNLVEPWPRTGPIDLVMLRNVLIYFDSAAKKDLLGRIARVLAADGHLFLGAAETTLNLNDAYLREQIGKAVSYRLRSTPG